MNTPDNKELPPNYVKWGKTWHGIDKHRACKYTFCGIEIPRGSKVQTQVTQPDRAMACARCFA